LGHLVVLLVRETFSRFKKGVFKVMKQKISAIKNKIAPLTKRVKKTLRHVPGWRSGNSTRTFFAVIGYLLTAVFLFGAFRQSVLWGGYSTAIFLFSLVFIFDIGEIWTILRLPKHDPLSVVFFLLVYLCVVSAITSIFSPFVAKLPERKAPLEYPVPNYVPTQGAQQ